MSAQPTIFDGDRLSMAESIELTAASLREYGARYDTWSIAFSGGKDSSTLLTLVVNLIESGRVPKPKRLFVLYGDTRMELIPLWLCASRILKGLSKREWITTRVVMAEMDQRFMVYMLGRGVPPPNNNQNRMGPLTMQARIWALNEILSIQYAVNAQASSSGRPKIDILNAEECSRIKELIAANTWPDKWTGTEPRGDELYENQYLDGSRQLLLPTIRGRKA